MRLFEIISAIALFAVFSVGTLQAVKPGMELYNKTLELEQKVDRDSFLSRGFIKVCQESSGEGWPEAIAEWKEMCLSLWPLDFLEYECGDDFYSQSWRKDGFEMRVEWPREKEK